MELKRRDFLRLCGLGAVGVGALAAGASATQTTPAREGRTARPAAFPAFRDTRGLARAAAGGGRNPSDRRVGGDDKAVS